MKAMEKTNLPHPKNISIKGIKDGLIIKTNGGSWRSLRKSILAHLEQQQEFLKGAQLAVDVGETIIPAADLKKFKDHIETLGMELKTVVSSSPVTEESAQALQLATRISEPVAKTNYRNHATDLAEDAILVHKTLRSGTRIQYQGHVIVIGDVNPGAEIFAGGNIVVWGKLRGTVHAGAQGNKDSVVCALDLSPTQLRIADKISIAPKRKSKPKPEIAKLVDNRVIAETWKP